MTIDELIDNIKPLEKILGYSFENKELLLSALSHPSFLNEHPGLGFPDQERLEFLGDAVLELVVSQYLFENYPQLGEGELTRMRALLVNTETLASMAQRVELQKFMLLGKGEKRNTFRERKTLQHLLANTFEALVGALFLEAGYRKTREFLLIFVRQKADSLKQENLRDPKSSLQELLQAQFKERPEYRVLSESGPDHSKKFVVGVYWRGKEIAKGEGTSKREAQARAAQKALEYFKTFKGFKHRDVEN